MHFSRPVAIGAAALLVTTLTALPQQANAAPGSLIFSAYLEGSSNNKALELYNPTNADINLSGYTIRLYSNGGTSIQTTWTGPNASLAPGDRFVLANSSASATLRERADALSAVTAYNGDDALELARGTDVVDSIGQVGTRPSEAWTGNGVSTKDQTLVRSSCEADTDSSDPFDPSHGWESHPIDSFDLLGTFHCDGATPPTPQPSATPTAEPPGDVLPIGTVQGSDDISAYNNKDVTIEGVVTASFQTGGFNGYFVQDQGDGNDATSDGIFVYQRTPSVTVGDSLRITGKVSEHFGQTQITPTTVSPLDKAAAIAPTAVSLPLGNHERYESMLLTFPDDLTILEYYDYDRYGTLEVGNSRQDTPTAVLSPGEQAQQLLATNLANRITLDDGLTTQNPSPVRHPNGEPFSRDNYFRGGDLLTDITGVLVYNFDEWKIEPTTAAKHTVTNPRPDVPAVGGDVTVASMNVLNYFTTLTVDDSNARGADNADEFERQRAKIVAAISEMDADVVGLMEIENNATAVENLVAALNRKLGEGTYAAVNTGVLGSDVIAQAFIYQPAQVALSGHWAAYDFKDGKTRPTLVQTFTHLASGKSFNVAVNHLKSKGSACAGDPNLNDGQGECNQTRLTSVNTMIDWLTTDPTKQGADKTLIIGDLNSYDHEDPIRALAAAGYTDLEKKFNGEHAYTYVFDGMIGYLDYALGNAAMSQAVTGASAWHINADESDLFDYDTSYKKQGEQALWAADPFRSSDHDPVLVGFTLTGDVPKPTPSVTPKPSVSPTQSPTQRPTIAPTATPSRPGPPSTGAAVQRNS